MKYKIGVSLLMILALFLTACGNDESGGEVEDAPETSTASSEIPEYSVDEELDEEIAEMLDIEEPVLFTLENKVEQLGGAEFDSSFFDESREPLVMVHDNQNILITPYIWNRSDPMYDNIRNEHGSFGFLLSHTVLEDDKVIIEENLTSYQEDLNFDPSSDRTYLDWELDRQNKRYIVEVYKEELSESGSATTTYLQDLYTMDLKDPTSPVAEKVREKTFTVDNYKMIEPTTLTRIVPGLDGLYLQECDDETCTIFNTEAEEMYTYSRQNIWPPNASSAGREISFLDEEEGLLYIGTSTQKAYDLENDDFLWDENGAELKFEYPSSGTKIGVENGFYHLDSEDKTTSTLSFWKKEDNTFVLDQEIDVVSELDKKFSTFTVTDTHVNVFYLVEYKGEPTFQKYYYPRVDVTE